MYTLIKRDNFHNLVEIEDLLSRTLFHRVVKIFNLYSICLEDLPYSKGKIKAMRLIFVKTKH